MSLSVCVCVCVCWCTPSRRAVCGVDVRESRAGKSELSWWRRSRPALRAWTDAAPVKPRRRRAPEISTVYCADVKAPRDQQVLQGPKEKEGRVGWGTRAVDRIWDMQRSRAQILKFRHTARTPPTKPCTVLRVFKIISHAYLVEFGFKQSDNFSEVCILQQSYGVLLFFENS